MGFRYSKRIKIAPGLSFRVNTKSVSMTVGGKRARYTVNSKGRRTASASIPGTGVSYRTTSSPNRRRSQTTRQQTRRAGRPVSQRWWLNKPIRELAAQMEQYGKGAPPRDVALACFRLAHQHRRLRIAGLTLAGVVAAPVDRDLAVQALSEAFAAGVEVSNNHIMRAYSPITYLRLPIVGVSGGSGSAEFPLNRDAVGAILVRLYVAAGALDAAAAVAAELQDAPLVKAARTLIDTESRMGHLMRQQQIRGGDGSQREA